MSNINSLNLPSLNPADYDQVIDGRTFTNTLNLDGAKNVLVMNSTFRNIDDHAVMLRNSENVTFFNNTFEDIHGVGILLRSSGSTENVSIINNRFEDIREDGINAAKRFTQGVDHENLLIYGNDFHDAGYGSKNLNIHTIYVQASDVKVINNTITGVTDTNAVSIRGDGLVAGNNIDVQTNNKYGSGIKYYSDHKAGDSDTLTIVDNVIEGNNLHSGIRLEYTNSNKPSSISQEDWVVNNFVISNNKITGNIPKYDVESEIYSKSWASVDLDKNGSPRDIWDLSSSTSNSGSSNGTAAQTNTSTPQASNEVPDGVFRIEAENLSYTGFTEKQSNDASGNGWLQADRGSTDSTATMTFDQDSGVYNLSLNYFDESDGVSEMSLAVDGQVIETWSWNQNLGSHLANSQTLTSRTFEALQLTKGSTIAFVGTRDGGEPLRIDSIDIQQISSLPQETVTPQTNEVVSLEAEDLSYKGFVEKSSNAASNGVWLQANADTSSVSTTHKQDAGVYNITLNYFDENDGSSEMSLVVDGQVIETWTWDQNLGSRLANSKTSTSKTFEKIELNENSEISFVGKRDSNEPLRIDSLDIQRVSGLPEIRPESTQKTISVELEDFTQLSNFKEVSNKKASNNAFVQTSNKGRTSKASLEFDGQDGNYNIVVYHYDENDGKSEMTLRVDGVDVHSWEWDQNLGSKYANEKTLTMETVEGVNLSKDSVVELVGKSDGGEPLRVDKIDFVPSKSVDQDSDTPVTENDEPSAPLADEGPKQGPSQAPSNDAPSKPIVTSSGDPKDVKAFVGAEGFGADSVGGRGGKVVHVTNLKNSGAGSLRAALEDVDGPRIVVFDVEGQINLRDEIVIKEPYVTIAGQTAPGEGVVVTGGRIKIETNDVIMRGMKIRPGDDFDGDTPRNRDAVSIGNDGDDIIIDHNSFTWALDETVAIWGRSSDITISNNIIAEALFDSIHVDEGAKVQHPHGMGFIVGNKNGVEGSENITVAKNLFASNNGRNPMIKQTTEFEFVNNYITNYGEAHQAASIGGGNAKIELAFVNNYFEDGQDTNSRESRPPIKLSGVHGKSELHIDGNYVEGHGNKQVHGNGQKYLEDKQTFKGSDLEILDASDVKDYVLNNVGARVNGELDAVDARILNDVENGTTRIFDYINKDVFEQREVRVDRKAQRETKFQKEFLSKEKRIGIDDEDAYGAYNFTGKKVQDTDRDGMPDWFEKQYAQYGFDYKRADDKGDYDGDGYTNIEEYINGLITGFDLGNNSSTVRETTLPEPVVSEPVVEAKPEPAPKPVVQPAPEPEPEPVVSEPVVEAKPEPTPQPAPKPPVDPQPEQPVYEETNKNDETSGLKSLSKVFEEASLGDVFVDLNEIQGTSGNDFLRGALDQSDLIDAGAGNDHIFSEDGDDVIRGGAGDDRIYGMGGNDIIHGGAGNDQILGGPGDDIIILGEGRDRVWGDQGKDTFVFESFDAHVDTIFGFETGADGDVINLTDILKDFDPLMDDILNFVQISDNNGNAEIQVNTGNSFETIAVVQGEVAGMTVNDLVEAGNLVVDQAVYSV